MTRLILLVTDGIVHPPLAGRWALDRSLRALPGLRFEQIRSLENLPAEVERFAALVLYFHHKTLSPAALTRLESYARQGGGILALHSATASFKDCPPYFEILGGRFVAHGRVEPFEMVNCGGGLFDDLPNFTLIDELYLHDFSAEIQVHFMSRHEGRDVPVVWTRHYGRGKICYAGPGHTAGSMNHPVYQDLLRRGLAWVAA
ncbi:MAG: hypothetical protein DDG60_00315 [Anaerolineae bacterium]|nr:MAG: hypothetical protein DDG60_00315 [Anaerolineae bacterium]